MADSLKTEDHRHQHARPRIQREMGTPSGGRLRHRDHRFEWTRAESQEWANRFAARFGYSVRFLPVDPEDSAVGSPTQLAVFEKKGITNAATTNLKG